MQVAKLLSDTLRDLKKLGPLKIVAGVICLVVAAYYIYTSYFGFRSPLEQRGPLVACALVLGFLLTPITRSRARNRSWTFVLDCLFAMLGLFVVGYLVIRENIMARSLTMTTADYLVGIAFLLLMLESTRRQTGGAPLVIISIVFLFYGHFGYLFPPPFRNPGFNLTQILTSTALTTDGIFGQPVEVVAKVVVIYMIFAALLEVSGGGEYFIKMPMAFFGRFRGGPAKVAVVGSGLFGTISGSVVANVTTVGNFTIPIMKSAGYSATTAAAIEAIGSCGGQIMPPVMAAVAFIMADIIGVSYWQVCIAAAIPAILYYLCLFLTVDLEAAKNGLKGLPASQLPPKWKTFSAGWPLILPLVVLIYLLALQYSPWKAAFWTIVVFLVVSMFSSKYRLTPRKFITGLVRGVSAMTMVTLICGTAGIVIGVIGMSGVSLGISETVVKLSSGNILLLSFITMVLSLIFGMGIPTTACYLFLAVTMAPAMLLMKVNIYAAHMFIFYFGVLSGITPPVAIGAFAAAAVARSNPNHVAFTACRIAIPIIIIPYAWVFNPALVLQQSSILAIIVAVISATLGVAATTSALTGYFLHRMKPLERVLFFVAGVPLIYTHVNGIIVGSVLLAIAVVYHIVTNRGVSNMGAPTGAT